MAAPETNYRVSKNALIMSGAIVLLVGLLIFLIGQFLIGGVIAVAGLVLLISGLLRPTTNRAG